MTTFAEFMEEALYGPDGYYSSGRAQTGTRGDYFTAPETGEAFGRLLKTIFMEWQTRLSVDSFWIIEAGAGEGRLMQGIASPGDETYTVIERSAARREKIRQLNLPIQICGDFSEIKNESVSGVIFANELIDAFPVHRVRMNNGKLEEGYVYPPRPRDAGEGLGEGEAVPSSQPSPDIRSGEGDQIVWFSPSTPRLSAYFDRLKITLPEGYETEVNLAMHDWIHQVAAVLSKGIIALIDYRPAWDYYAEERSGGTLRCFSGHQVMDPFKAGPPHDRRATSLDWTSDVDFTSLALDAKEAGLEPLAFMEMGTFLKLGVQPIVGAGHRPRPQSQSQSQSESPLKLSSQPECECHGGRGRCPAPTGLKYLLHPDGLGAQFHVLILGKNIDPTEWKFEHNRIARLGLMVSGVARHTDGRASAGSVALEP